MSKRRDRMKAIITNLRREIKKAQKKGRPTEPKDESESNGKPSIEYGGTKLP